MFKTAYKRSPSKGEKMSTKSKVETAGYMPAKTRIENMINAGQRLVDYRKQMYDFVETEPDETVGLDDPDRIKNFDLADATMASNRGKNAFENVQEALKGQSKQEKGVNTPEDKTTPE